MNFMSDRAVLLDGATGTNLIKHGMPQGVCPEQWILSHPEISEKLQYDYIMNGSDIIYAPTFGANPAVLSRFGLEEQTEAMNQKLIEISLRARQKSGKNVLIAQDLSPTGLFMRPYGDCSFEQIEDIYYRQALAGTGAGADLFVIETSISLSEALAALSAVKRAAPQKPAIVTMTLENSGRTVSGNTLEACLVALYCAGADAFGINCSQGPEEMVQSVKQISRYSGLIPIVAKPNAGLPHDDGNGQKYYNLKPKEFVELAAELLDNGVSIIGGCCGTDPEYIGELHKLLQTHTVNRQPVIDISNLACSDKEVFCVDADLQQSEVLKCDPDLADSIMDAQDNGDEIIRVFIEKPDDLEYLTEASYLINAPLMLGAGDFETLKKAVKGYAGRVILDPDCPIEPAEKEMLIKTHKPVELK